MKRLCRVVTHLLLIAVTAGLLYAATNAWAEASASVNIPFAFTANHHQMPAGYYKVERVSNRFLSFIDVSTGKHVTFVLINPEQSESIAIRGALIFHVNGQRYMLTEVRIAGSSMRSRLIVQPSLVEEMAMKQSGERPFIEIAMN